MYFLGVFPPRDTGGLAFTAGWKYYFLLECVARGDTYTEVGKNYVGTRYI